MLYLKGFLIVAAIAFFFGVPAAIAAVVFFAVVIPASVFVLTVSGVVISSEVVKKRLNDVAVLVIVISLIAVIAFVQYDFYFG